MRGSMKRAFSLIEVVLVVGLAGLLGSVALPRVRSTVELLHCRDAMQQVAADLRVMQFRALNERRGFAMRIDPAARRLQVVCVESGEAPREYI